MNRFNIVSNSLINQKNDNDDDEDNEKAEEEPENEETHGVPTELTDVSHQVDTKKVEEL